MSVEKILEEYPYLRARQGADRLKIDPAFIEKIKETGMDIDDDAFKHIEAIIHSMTPD